MKTMILRGLDMETFEQIRAQSAASGASLNRCVLQMLHKAVHPSKAAAEYHDLDEFFGSWDEDAFKQMTLATKNQRKIDKDVWL